MSAPAQDTNRKSWAEFRAEYEQKRLSRTSAANQESAKIALDHFERLVKPRKAAVSLRLD